VATASASSGPVRLQIFAGRWAPRRRSMPPLLFHPNQSYGSCLLRGQWALPWPRLCGVRASHVLANIVAARTSTTFLVDAFVHPGRSVLDWILARNMSTNAVGWVPTMTALNGERLKEVARAPKSPAGVEIESDSDGDSLGGGDNLMYYPAAVQCQTIAHGTHYLLGALQCMIGQMMRLCLQPGKTRQSQVIPDSDLTRFYFCLCSDRH
jgi:hypothetical protein